VKRIVVENTVINKITELNHDCFRLSLAPFSKVSAIKPGQFVHVQIPGNDIFFRRAFSIYTVDKADRSIELLFKVFGRGTSRLARCRKGDRISVVGPLGNSFKLPSKKETPILVAGGVGMPPMRLLAEVMIERGFEPGRIIYLYGGNTKDDLVDIARIRKPGIKVVPVTLDGSCGKKGLVTEPLLELLDTIEGPVRMYGCGPEPMLKAVDDIAMSRNIPGQVSLEAPMPCGVGICLGCIKPLREGGYTRVCRDGPVYDFGEVLL
jgi:dihydroorotate dehydrogenase electron transfer subunit